MRRTSLDTVYDKQAMVQQVLQEANDTAGRCRVAAAQEKEDPTTAKTKLTQADHSETSGDILNNLNLMKFMTVTNVCGSNL